MNRRQWYEDHTKVFGRIFAYTRLTPNQLTILSLVPAVVSGYYYAHGRELVGLLFLVVTLGFDVVDGAVARILDKKTDFGAVLDATIDRICEFIVLFGIALGGLADNWIAFFCFSGMVMASYVRARIESKGVSAMSVGFMERMQKMVFIMVGSLLLSVYNNSLNVALFAVGFLSYITVVQRLLYARRNLS